jgi:uncharacterized protein YqfB (UPF0267 family)
MVAYSFKRQFAEPILTGTKGGTIRGDRRRHARPSEELQLYTGMRTKHCRLITRKTCIAVEVIHLDFIVSRIAIGGHLWLSDDDELDIFARFDGFQSWPELAAFWRGTHGDVDEFNGWHIRWMPLPSSCGAAG